jgi:hypothetical protein
MHLLLFLAGTVSAAAGALSVAYGLVRPASFPLVDGILVSATIGIVGGFLLIGLGSALVRLRKLSDVLETQPFPRMVMAPLDGPAPGAPSANLGAFPPPALRPAPPIVAESGSGPVTAHDGAPDITVHPPSLGAVGSEPASGKDEVVGLELPRVSETDRIAPALELPPRDTLAGAVAAALDLSPRDALEASSSALETESERKVLKSGVIEGMAYTLFSDGSVDADLPGGLTHFASISAWRAHMREHAA